MADDAPIYLTSEGSHITKVDWLKALQMSHDTGRQVILTSKRRRRWWKFWDRGPRP